MTNLYLDSALEALRGGRTLLYPTDTIWGIGCDATDAAAIEKIYAVKERDHSKSMLILATEAMLSPRLPAAAADLLLRSERPTTLILPAPLVAAPLALNLPAADDTVGVRVPRMDFCQALLQAFGRPIVSTSANFSGHPSPAAYAEIADELKQRLDCCLPDAPEFRHPATGSSRILRLAPDGAIQVLRD